jgi:hypothetical protein
VCKGDLQDLHTSTNIFWAMNSKIIERGEHLACMGRPREKQLA